MKGALRSGWNRRELVNFVIELNLKDTCEKSSVTKLQKKVKGTYWSRIYRLVPKALLLVSDEAAPVGELACLLPVSLLHIRAACETNYFVRASIDAAESFLRMRVSELKTTGSTTSVAATARDDSYSWCFTIARHNWCFGSKNFSAASFLFIAASWETNCCPKCGIRSSYGEGFFAARFNRMTQQVC